MPVAWYPTRWWDWCIPEDEKKVIESMYTDKAGKWLKNSFSMHWYYMLVGLLKHFGTYEDLKFKNLCEFWWFFFCNFLGPKCLPKIFWYLQTKMWWFFLWVIYIYVYICIYLSIHPSIYLSIYLCICLSLSIYTYTIFPLISARSQIINALLDIHIEISASPLISTTPLDAALTRIVTIFY